MGSSTSTVFSDTNNLPANGHLSVSPYQGAWKERTYRGSQWERRRGVAVNSDGLLQATGSRAVCRELQQAGEGGREVEREGGRELSRLTWELKCHRSAKRHHRIRLSLPHVGSLPSQLTAQAGTRYGRHIRGRACMCILMNARPFPPPALPPPLPPHFVCLVTI